MQKYQDVVQDSYGNARAGLSVIVQTFPGGAVAAIYSDNGITFKSNPLTTDALGKFSFYAADGRYQLVISGSGITPITVSDIVLEDVVGAITNLTGPITSVGNATAVNSQTGTGSTFVMQTNPVLVGPALGTPVSGVATNLTGTAAGLTAGTVTTNANLTGEVTSVGNAATLTNSAVIAKVLTGYVSGAGVVAATDTILAAIQKLNGNDATNANLTGEVTSVGNATTVTNAAVIGKVLTGYVSGAGVVASTDTILAAIQKLNGNDATNANLTGECTSVGNATTLLNSAVIGKVLTGYVSGAGVVAATDTILQAIQKLNANDATNANLTGDVTSVGNATTLATVNGGVGSFTNANITVNAKGLITAAASGSGGSSGFTTGDVKPTFKTTADTGWVMLNDGTIGDASSVATTRANADTSALFTLLWTNLSNTQAPVSGGRGASAAADFAAHKTITLPLALGRAFAAAGAGSGLTSRALGLTLGEESHVLTTAELASHNHGVTDPGHTHNVTAGLGGGVGSSSSFFGETTNVGTSDHVTSSNGSGITIQNNGSGTAHNNIQPTIFLNWMIML